MTANSFPNGTLNEIQGRKLWMESGQGIDRTDIAPVGSRETAQETGVDSRETLANLIAPSTLLRWCKFNLVGGIGILVQVVALFFLRGVMHFNYLFATAIAVEAAVVHNFVWHEQFTWADRVRGAPRQASGGEAPNILSRLCGPSLRRLLRFNLSNGAVSILGNLALMRVMVGQGHMNYLLANGIAIALCSVANFLVSDEWVFERE
jgi:putative flippase GtrA